MTVLYTFGYVYRITTLCKYVSYATTPHQKGCDLLHIIQMLHFSFFFFKDFIGNLLGVSKERSLERFAPRPAAPLCRVALHIGADAVSHHLPHSDGADEVELVEIRHVHGHHRQV